MTSHLSFDILQKDTGPVTCSHILHNMCESSVDSHFVNDNMDLEEWENGKYCSKQDKTVCVNGTIVDVGGEVSHLRAVVKPPEEGQCSGVTRPNHHSQISFLPLDGYNRSGEIYTLHRT